MPYPNSALILQANPDAPASEAYRALRFKLEFLAGERGSHVVAFTSVQRGGGTTTTVIHVAAAFAQIGRKVLLVDANLRSPAACRAFSVENTRGLAQILSGQTDAADLIRPSGIPNLSLLPAGQSTGIASELLAIKRMDALLAELRGDYDLVLVDTAPVLGTTDGKVVAAKCDGVVLVLPHGKVKRTAARIVKEEFALSRTNLLGVVWNRVGRQDAKVYLNQ